MPTGYDLVYLGFQLLGLRENAGWQRWYSLIKKNWKIKAFALDFYGATMCQFLSHFAANEYFIEPALTS